MKGVFVTNKYYTDEGMEYVFNSFKKAFYSLNGVELTKISPFLVYEKTILSPQIDADFVLFWDKQAGLARAMQRAGLRVFNSAEAIDACDDKQKTYAALKNVKIPKTVCAPLMYDVNAQTDIQFLNFVEQQLGYPLIAKEDTGSQGRQVFKAENRAQLKKLYQRLRHKPHHYQQLIGQFGCDIRVYTAGAKALAAYKRHGVDFKSNLHCGGYAQLIEPKEEYLIAAENISAQLGLDFGAIDFLIDDQPVFLEANSNAYFKGIEQLGVDISGKIAAHIIKTVLK